jgi:hypothetical protein
VLLLETTRRLAAQERLSVTIPDGVGSPPGWCLGRVVAIKFVLRNGRAGPTK